ncbi:hypothetical protein E3A20_03230 [Planctomyces bekefii]|uniref:Uncharacterized protein n=1 Tax=Planctomyces bekefii TaxID=1653850 RepID=A0A5C6MGU5_9PLAN|nr:hypothetical protein E3A20_03230 [Planctomyces bekefii]
MTNIYCKTDRAILILGVPDDRGVLFFPSNRADELPGLHLDVKPLLPIFDQLTGLASAVLKQDVARSLHLFDEFADEIAINDSDKGTVFVGTLSQVTKPEGGPWAVMPAILRALPKTRVRLPYLRAWQILQGGLKLNTKAVDPAELAKYFDD